MVDVPKSWKTFLNEPNPRMNFSSSVENWLFYEAQLKQIVGVPLGEDDKPFAIFMSVDASKRLPNLSLKIKVHSKAILANPSYIVETNFSVSSEQRRINQASASQTSVLSYYSAIFILKLSKFLTHVNPDDISIVSVKKNIVNSDHLLFPLQTISVRWFVEKFTPKTFLKHYKPMLINPENGDVTRDFFFALLPQFTLDSVKIVIQPSEIEGLSLDTPTRANPGQIHLSVAIPIIVVLVFILVATLILLWRYRRRKGRFGRDILVDKTYAKRRYGKKQIHALQITFVSCLVLCKKENAVVWFKLYHFYFAISSCV